jgi:prepilin-type N-terminal cleavage/methylation domain-containing protein
MKRSYKGFTLIELLVVIAIIGLLSTLAVVALNSARQRSRDAKRVADIRQIQTALELAFSETSAYPVATGATGVHALALGNSTSGTVLCKGTQATPLPVFNGSTVASPCAAGGTYMGLVPSNPTPNGGTYGYNSDASGSKYSIMFTLEGDTGQLKAGANCANPNGIVTSSGACL